MPFSFYDDACRKKKIIDVQLLPFMNKNLLATVKRAAQYVQKREGDLLHQNITGMFLSTTHSQYNAITNHLKCPLSFGLSTRDEIIHSEWRHPSCIWQPKSQRPCMQNGFPTLFPDEELQDDWLLANKCVSLIFLLSPFQVCTQVCACKCRCVEESWLS